jgi:hypothetical protein
MSGLAGAAVLPENAFCSDSCVVLLFGGDIEDGGVGRDELCDLTARPSMLLDCVKSGDVKRT